MKLNYLHLQFTIVCLLISSFVTAQTCNGTPFNSPGKPTTCTYTYTNTGWKDASGNSISTPSSDILATQSVCIMANNSDYIGSGPGNPKFYGTLYIAPGVTFSGRTREFIGAKIVVEGTLNFSAEPVYTNTKMYVDESGKYIETKDLEMLAGSEMHNAGELNTYGKAVFGGNSKLINYSNAYIHCQGQLTTNEVLYNCGLIEVEEKLTAGGGNGFKNLCTLSSVSELKINGDATNDGILYTEDRFVFTGSTFVNNGTLIANNTDLQNQAIVGNGTTSLLVIATSATRGAGITGHYYYDIDDGGGFDDTCNTCIPGLDILVNNPLPATTAEIFENCGFKVKPKPFIEKSTLDFDGVDDYLSTPSFLNGLSNVTMMAWVKSDNGNSTTMTIAGEDTAARIYLTNGNIPTFTISTLTGSKTISSAAIKLNEWHHITGTYSSSAKTLRLYVDGELASSSTNLLSGNIRASLTTNNNFEIGRRATSGIIKEYFKGDIDEVRIFNSDLTSEQIEQIVYQEIKNNNGYLQGSVIAKDIIDVAINKKISWSNLIAYYPMTDIISYKRTTDFSSKNRITKLHNITTFVEQTAPMPYTTKSNGTWGSQNTWTYGQVWDIEDTNANKDWSIVKIDHDVSTTDSHTNLGLIVADSKTLTVKNDNLIENTWYLELNGTIELSSDSQLIQGIYSDLVSSANGKIIRRQEGTSNKFRYNYWSSPVGATSANALGNDNSSNNNANNSNFNLGLLKDGNGNAIQFTSANDAVGKISTRWTYKFQNGVTYFDWTNLNSGTAINPGVGYIHKGTGNNGNSQQYIFEGKPNNGTIKINATDTGGAGSVPNVSQTSSLLGNPYASALDLHKFIDDNAGVISGTLRLWQQWSGNSHILTEYNGGYAEINKLGSVRAYQFEGIEGGTTGQQDGTLTATRYLPVGQGFVAEIISNGTVEFNNSQRIFVKEADANNTYNQGSVFFRTRETPDWDAAENGNLISKIRLEFNCVEGPRTKRELLMGFSTITTDEYDYGYDSKNFEKKADDLLLAFKDENMNMQAYAEIKPTKEVALNLTASGDYSYSIKATEFENLDAEQEVYLRDKLTGEYFDLRKGKDYTFNSAAGEFKERFTIVFQSEEAALTLDTEEVMPYLPEHDIFYSTLNDKLYVKGMTQDAKSIYLLSMSGQTVKILYNVHVLQMNMGIELSNISSGPYVVCVVEEGKEIVNKKIIID